MELNKIYNEDCLLGIKKMPDNSCDCILIDPPYKYLKNQKLEIDFDENIFFPECYRVLKRNGFLIMFGRGESFYRWNNTLSGLGMKFKEEIIWDKSYNTSPLMAISRVHETISIYTKGDGIIRKVKVPYIEMKSHDIDSVIKDVNRLKSVFKNTKSLDAVIAFLTNNEFINTDKGAKSITISSEIDKADRQVSTMKSVRDGCNEKSIIRTDFLNESTSRHNVSKSEIKDGEKEVNIVQSIGFGMNEKSIIKQPREHYKTIHPTQKPIRLLERLLNLTVSKGAVVADFFSGSGSTAIACVNLGIQFICFEIDKEYWELSIDRLNVHYKETTKQIKLF